MASLPVNFRIKYKTEFLNNMTKINVWSVDDELSRIYGRIFNIGIINGESNYSNSTSRVKSWK